ncbi:CpsD/CapB family tyrosine-protein kinase [Deinococcus apachensis]|uniref:CpsD/CapB family tyrosine-protein kinase n=1 Tax=Deinococcus apachensis TaxID=309886 RepID=UPI0003651090|nr:CpsD/CapB family tyrosine-protein kinase [Deinococcus apachensis]
MTAYRPPEPDSPDLLRQDTDNEIDLATLWQGVRQRLPVILLTAALLALAVYLWSRAQPRVYEAAAGLLASSSQSQIGVVGGSVISPLPPGTVAEVVESPLILRPLIEAVRDNQAIAPAERQRLVKQLTRELLTPVREGEGSQRNRTVSVTADQGGGENSIYQVRARAQTPQAAQVLVNLTGKLLLNWDAERTLRDVRLARENFTLQLAQTDRRLALPGLSALERQTLLYRRATMQDNLAQLSFLEQARPGVLKPLTSAVEPLRPVTPSPLRNAVLAGLLALLLGTGVAALLSVLDRRVQTDAELLTLNLPVLGRLPRLRPSGSFSLAQSEALGFLRVNLQATLRQPRPILMIAGLAGGEGASSLTAALASSLADSGQRVLLLDADLWRGGQQDLWDVGTGGQPGHAPGRTGGAHSFAEALRAPVNVEVKPVAPNIDLLPAGSAPHGSLALLSRPELGEWLRRWSQGYDVVLVDSPPLLALADGLALGQQVDAVLLVTEMGRTRLPDVCQVLRSARLADVPVVGFVLNKVAGPSRMPRRYGPALPAPPAPAAPTPTVKEVR